MLARLHRSRRKLLVLTAAVPMLQVTGCDPAALTVGFLTNFGSIVSQQVVVAGASAVAQIILRAFPGSQILQALLGGNANFFPPAF